MVTIQQRAAGKASRTTSPSNVHADKSQSLQTFNLSGLRQFTQDKAYSDTASEDFHLFYVGRDDVHENPKYVLSRVRVSLYLNMFGYDDDELKDIIIAKALDPSVTVVITLDQSQAGGVHEKTLLAADFAKDPKAFNTYFVVGQSVAEAGKNTSIVAGQSATRQISHTKGFVADGKLGAEASTNWSTSGEGTFVVQGKAGGSGYKAQNNTQSIFTDPDTINRFQTELIAEQLAAQTQKSGSPSSLAPSAPKVPTATKAPTATKKGK